MDIAKQLSMELGLTQNHTNNIISLLDEGCTIPFIARYRKELTGSCDDQTLRLFDDRLKYLRNLTKRKEEVANAWKEAVMKRCPVCDNICHPAEFSLSMNSTLPEGTKER